MFTGIIPFDYSEDTIKNSESTWLRVDSLVAGDAGFEKWVHGRKYDSLIFHQTYWLQMMQLFKGPKILDLCDPDWIKYDVNIRETGDHVHAITCASKELTDLVKSYFPEKIVEHVPDRLDLKTFPPPRAAHQGKMKRAVWFGYIHEAHETLPQLLSSVRKLDLQLRIISDLPYSSEDGILELNPEFLYYEPSKVNEQIREADILLNPRSGKAFYRYTSNKKSLVGWRSGLPVAVTGDDVRRLMSPDERNREVSEMQPVIEQDYYIEKTAEQYRDIIYRITQEYF